MASVPQPRILIARLRDPARRDRNCIEVVLLDATDGVVLEVRDNGPGLDADAAAALFEPYATRKERPSSLGLGLAICRTLARRNGGDITVSSWPSQGTSFRVLLGGSEEPILEA